MIRITVEDTEDPSETSTVELEGDCYLLTMSGDCHIGHRTEYPKSKTHSITIKNVSGTARLVRGELHE